MSDEKNTVAARFPVDRKLWGEVKGEATARGLKVPELMEEILKKRYNAKRIIYKPFEELGKTEAT